MRKYFQYFLIVWAIAFAIFNVIVWVIPNELYGYSKTAGSFWAGYIFIDLAFAGMLVCGYLASKAENKEKLFLNMPLLTVSYTGLIIMLIAGSVCMAVPGIPNWLGLIICLLILGASAIAIVSAKAAAEMVEGTGESIAAKTAFIKRLTVDAQNLMESSKTGTAMDETKKVFEAVRYSDPMSCFALEGTDCQIKTKYDAFANAVRNGNDEEIIMLSEELRLLIKDRNRKCKLMK